MTAVEHAPTPTGGVFASLRSANYRRYAAGQLVSLVGTWMQRVAQDWLVLELSGGSATALGFAAFLQFGPSLLLSVWGGVLADRLDKRRLLVVLQSAMGLCALLLGLAVVTGLVRLWHVFVLCAVLGCFAALDIPVRQAFISELVTPGQLPNAVALNTVMFNSARIAGPALAGVTIAAVGTGWAFLINAVSFAAVVAALLAMKETELFRNPSAAKDGGGLRAALRYVRGRHDLLVVVGLAGIMAAFCLNYQVTLPVLVRNVFGLGAPEYGLLTSLVAIGSVAGGVVAARRTARPRLRVVLGSALAFGVLVIVAGLMPSYPATGVVMVLMGFAALSFTTAANASVQLGADPGMRGRVIGLYMLLFVGGTPLGAPILGAVAERWGGRAPLVFGGAVGVLAVLVVVAVLASRVGGWRELFRMKPLAPEPR